MPLLVTWYLENRVISVEASGEIAIEEVQQYRDQLIAMLEQARLQAPGRKICNLYDATNALGHPPMYLVGKMALPVLRYNNRGPLYMVTTSSTMVNMMKITAHMMAFPVQVFSHRDEAIQRINTMLAYEDEQI